MAVINTSVPTLLDLTKNMAPNGMFDTERVNLLAQTNEMLMDMVWKEGNLPTGHRTTVITGLPSVDFRRINEGVALSKSTSAQIDESAAMLEGFSQVDRELAVLSGNVARYRYEEAMLFQESMSQVLQQFSLYGNAATNPAAFTGLIPRYNTLSGNAGAQVIDGGGTGSNNTSILLVGWGPSVFGLYPKGTVGGFFHEDATANRQPMEGVPGAWIGDTLLDENSRQFMGYKDHFIWRCGLVVRDYRAISRIANINVANLVTGVGAADLTELMIRATYKIPTNLRKNRGAMGFGRPAFYVNATVKAWLHIQQKRAVANSTLTLSNIDGEEVLTLLGIPIRETDQLLNTEARVV